MRKLVLVFAVGLLITTTQFQAAPAAKPAPAAPSWSMNATYIEACSCPMFCQCYFNTKPAAHHVHGSEQHFCRFNMGVKVNKGHFGKVKLAGAKYWIAGDLGEEFGEGEADWAIVTFEPSATKEQRDGIAAILGHIYPVKWKSFAVAPDAGIEWQATNDRAEARLNGGKTAEIVLHRSPTGMTTGPTVIRNLKYFGAPRNDGFVMMPNEVEAYREGPNAFQYNGTTGFMITIDISSRDVAKPAGK